MVFAPYVLSNVKLFFLSGKRTFYHAYLTYIVYIDFFGNFSLCFLFLFLSILLQSCTSFSKYSAVGDSTKNILDQTNILLSFLCFVHLDQSNAFSLSTFKIQRKSKNILMMYSMYPFYKNYTAYWKSNPCRTNKNNSFTFILKFFLILLKT